jgi:hypothetical protein
MLTSTQKHMNPLKDKRLSTMLLRRSNKGVEAWRIAYYISRIIYTAVYVKDQL